MKKKIQFMGFLSNADSSILKLKLDKGYEICSMPEKEGAALISTFDKVELLKAHMDNSSYFNSAEKKMYYISNSFESDIKMNKEGILTDIPSGTEFSDFKEYGSEITRLMRLFKEGDIRMAKSYYYYTKGDGSYSNFLSMSNSRLISDITKYHLEDSEIPELEDFINKIKLPFEQSYLQLAFESFEESYSIQNRGLSFLTLMIALEVLFSPADRLELSYRIRRNIAVLLGKTQGESEEIYKEIRKLYDIRCEISHEGKWNSVKQESLLILREYVRKAIKEISLFGKSKDDLSDLLHTSGFSTNLVKENQDDKG